MKLSSAGALSLLPSPRYSSRSRRSHSSSLSRRMTAQARLQHACLWMRFRKSATTCQGCLRAYSTPFLSLLEAAKHAVGKCIAAWQMHAAHLLCRPFAADNRGGSMKGPVASNSFYCPISMELMADPVSWKLFAYPIRRGTPLVLREPAGLPTRGRLSKDWPASRWGYQPEGLSQVWLASPDELSVSLTSLLPMWRSASRIAGRANLARITS